MKLQVRKGLPSKLQTAAILVQSLSFDAMMGNIEKVISASTQDNSKSAHRQYRGRDHLQIMDEEAPEELEEFLEKQRQRSEEVRSQNVWTHQGVGTAASLIGSRDNVLPFGFTAIKPCFWCKRQATSLAFEEFANQNVRVKTKV